MNAQAGLDDPVLIAGWIGSTNLGDELLATVLEGRLEARGFSCVAPSLNPSDTESSLGMQAFSHRSLLANRAAIATCRALLVGGGSLVSDVTSHLHLPYHLSRPLYAGRIGRAFGGVGLGAGPIRSRFARWLTKRAFAKARVVGTRDPESADALRSLGVESVVEAADLALSLPSPTVEVEAVIGVSLRPPMPGGLLPVASRSQSHDEGWLSAMASALDSTANATGLPIRFIPMQTDRDHAVHTAVHERMKTDATHTAPTVDSVIRELAGAQVVVAMRYHAGIGAVIGGRPAVMLSYAPKVGSLVSQVGSGFKGLSASSADMAEIPKAVGDVLHLSDEVGEARGRLREIERRNEDVIDQVLGL